MSFIVYGFSVFHSSFLVSSLFAFRTPLLFLSNSLFFYLSTENILHTGSILLTVCLTLSRLWQEYSFSDKFQESQHGTKLELANISEKKSLVFPLRLALNKCHYQR